MQAMSSAPCDAVVPAGGIGAAPPAATAERVTTERARQILIVDSYADNRDLYCAWFASLGYGVTPCATAAAALDIAGWHRFDAVITSVRLFPEDGFALCDALKGDPATADIPIMALTSAGSDHDRSIRDGRFAAVVMIPCAPDRLSCVLAQVLQHKAVNSSHLAA
jgi:CheY-like chemotaxis protein